MYYNRKISDSFAQLIAGSVESGPLYRNNNGHLFWKKKERFNPLLEKPSNG